MVHEQGVIDEEHFEPEKMQPLLIFTRRAKRR